MDFAIDTLGPCRKKIAVTVPPERIQEEYDRQYDEINEAVALPGFRPGHAPRRLLEKRFATAMGREVKEKLVEKAMKLLVEEQKIEPLQQPTIDLDTLEIDPEKALEFAFELITRPEFETPDYKGLSIDVEPVSIEDGAVDEAVDQLRQTRATLQTVEDVAVEEGDILVVDWEAKDGDSVVAHDENAYTMVGRGVLAGFVTEDVDKALAGKKVGAKASAPVRVAVDDPREELRGKDLTLDVELKEIKRYVLPDIDEEFLKAHDFDDEAEMRSEMEKHLERSRTRERERDAETRLTERLVESIEMSLPESFVDAEMENWARRKRTELEMEKVAEDEISKQIDAERGDAKAAVEKDMRTFFLLDRIADEADIKVAEAEILQAIQGIAQAYGRPEAEVLASFRDGGRIAELANQIRHRKVRELIRREAKLEEKAGAGGTEGAKTATKKKPAAKKKASTKKKAATKKKAKKDD